MNTGYSMNFREHYAKKRAFEMYYQMAERGAVIQMLQGEGAGEDANRLADEYYENFLFIQNHHKKKKQKAAGGYITIGVVFILASFAYAILTYLLFEGGSFIVLSGLFVSGIVSLVKGLSDKKG